jgi:hypothetical protein
MRLTVRIGFEGYESEKVIRDVSDARDTVEPQAGKAIKP